MTKYSNTGAYGGHSHSNHHSLIVEDIRYLSNEHGEIYLALKWMLHFYCLVFIVLEVASRTLPEEKNNHQSHPGMNSVSYNKGFPDKN